MTSGAVARRRGPSIKTVLLLSFLLLLIIASVGGILLWQRVAAFNDSVSTAPAASSSLWGALGGEERINIALFGYGGAEHKSGNYLADSIQILSIDPEADTTTIIPIPRDFWVEGLSQIPDNGKINEAFAIGWQAGGAEEASALTTEILSDVTGLDIHHWMAIDFSGFQGMIDAVGGVTLRNPRFFRYTWNEWKFSHNVWDYQFARGEITLTGKEALDYARARYTDNPRESSDFARSVRQQRVLAALRDKIGPGGLGSLGPGLSMMDALTDRMKTDLSAIDLFLLSGHLEPDRRIQLKEGRILEATSNTIGQYILVVMGRADSADYQPLHDYLERELARPIRRPNASASGSPGS
ncbi:MAG TPA: LCP family protein [Candidatus Limnocylindria bacterium]|nr:LCP family protein [Candidatus Limnocylindria bacterium]